MEKIVQSSHICHSQLFLLLMFVTINEPILIQAQVYGRVPLYWDLSDVSLRFGLGLWILGRKITGAKHPHSSPSIVHSINMIYDC